MPELPEVETVRRQLQKLITGQTIKTVEVLSDKQVCHNENFEQQLIGKVFSNIDRIGKLLIFSFKDYPDLFLLGHLKMTGQLLVVDRRGQLSGGGHTFKRGTEIVELPNRHTRIILNLADDMTLYFNDLRKFGYLKTVNKAQLEEISSRFGPEPISDQFDFDQFYETLQSSSTPIKVLLLDQKRVGGLGNIYVDETLWHAGVLPTRASNSISKSESDLIAKWSGQVLIDSIQAGGTTFKDFADTTGQHGNYRDYLKVFGRSGELCMKCDSLIEKIKFRGRGTHYCPQCQS